MSNPSRLHTDMDASQGEGGGGQASTSLVRLPEERFVSLPLYPYSSLLRTGVLQTWEGARGARGPAEASMAWTAVGSQPLPGESEGGGLSSRGSLLIRAQCS